MNESTKSAPGSSDGPKPYDLLEPPRDSSTGLTAAERREVFRKRTNLAEHVDIKKNLEWFGCDLSLVEFPELQRTKHVHRLHPYLGKFIPQLVELFLRRFFVPGECVLDPFSGSGTTLIEANILGIHSVGFELSPFNALIQEVKTRKHDIDLLEREVEDALAGVTSASEAMGNQGHLFPPDQIPKTENEFLNAWFAPRSLGQILYYRERIPQYASADVLKIILSRVARSCRLIPHHELAWPKQPLEAGTEYYCYKHSRQCRPIEDGLKFFRRYSKDTVERLRDFSRRRTDAHVEIIQGDARDAPLPEGLLLDGILTSPPYVGVIDYHEQHRYAYELFPEFQRNDEVEIGPMSQGKGLRAKAAYSEAMALVFGRLKPYLKSDARIFIVANDSSELYPDIIRRAGLRLVDTFHRPVPMRTGKDTRTYFESIFRAEKK